MLCFINIFRENILIMVTRLMTLKMIKQIYFHVLLVLKRGQFNKSRIRRNHPLISFDNKHKCCYYIYINQQVV